MVKLWLGDAYATVASWNCAEVSLLLVDPPYDIHAGAGGGCFGSRGHLIKTGGFTDGGCDYSFLSTFDNWMAFCSRKQLIELLQIANGSSHRWNLLTWCKPNPVPTCNNKYLPDVEYIVHGFEKGRLFGDYSDKASFHVYPCGNKETNHPNEKPIEVMSRLVTLGSETTNIVADVFMGSGSTGVAAIRLGRRFWGVESDTEHFATAKARIIAELPENRAPLFRGVEMRETQKPLGFAE